MKIFAIGVAVILAAGCGSSDPAPKPLERRFDEMHVARFTLEQKTDIIKARNDWEVSRMENANAEAQLGEIDNQLGIVKNEQKAAKLAVDNANTNKKTADTSADTKLGVVVESATGQNEPFAGGECFRGHGRAVEPEVGFEPVVGVDVLSEL